VNSILEVVLIWISSLIWIISRYADPDNLDTYGTLDEYGVKMNREHATDKSIFTHWMPALGWDGGMMQLVLDLKQNYVVTGIQIWWFFFPARKKEEYTTTGKLYV
jgi:hypothetical protein